MCTTNEPDTSLLLKIIGLVQTLHLLQNWLSFACPGAFRSCNCKLLRLKMRGSTLYLKLEGESRKNGFLLQYHDFEKMAFTQSLLLLYALTRTYVLHAFLNDFSFLAKKICSTLLLEELCNKQRFLEQVQISNIKSNQLAWI